MGILEDHLRDAIDDAVADVPPGPSAPALVERGHAAMRRRRARAGVAGLVTGIVVGAVGAAMWSLGPERAPDTGPAAPAPTGAPGPDVYGDGWRILERTRQPLSSRESIAYALTRDGEHRWLLRWRIAPHLPYQEISDDPAAAGLPDFATWVEVRTALLGMEPSSALVEFADDWSLRAKPGVQILEQVTDPSSGHFLPPRYHTAAARIRVLGEVRWLVARHELAAPAGGRTPQEPERFAMVADFPADRTLEQFVAHMTTGTSQGGGGML